MTVTEPAGPNRASAPACAHCGLPVPAALIAPDAEHQFCCHGCETVFGIIHAQGFEAYYRMRDELPGRPAGEPGASFEELDDPAFVTEYGTARPDGLVDTELYLEGVHCSACLWLVESSLAREAGVAEAKLNFARGRLRLSWRPDEKPLSAIARRLASLGYTPHPARGGTRTAERMEERRLIIRLGVAGAVAGNVMLMAFALYGGWFSGMAADHRLLFRYMSLVVSLPAVLYAAWPFYRSAANALKQGVLHMDLPISLGIGAGFLGGLANTLRDRGEIYFDSVTALIFLLLVGRLLQLRQQRRATESSELLYALTPSSARRLDDDGVAQRVPLEAIRPGDRLEVKVGERIPTDGVVHHGASSVDMSLLSGESMPVAVKRDDEVWGGTTNLQDDLVVRVTKAIRDSRVGRMADLVVEAGQSRAPVVQLADRVAGWFVAVVVMLALVTFAGWSFVAPEHAIDHAVALLIVSCPCALGLATPLAVTAAMGKAARRGILVRTGAALETLGSLGSGTIFFDKTGTLTHGRLDLVRFEGPDWVRPLVAAAERDSTHPVGRALRAALDAPEVRFDPEDLAVTAGGGLEARVDGHRVVVGSPKFVGRQALRDHDLELRTGSWSEEALTPVWIAVDGRVLAVAGLADRIRSEARTSLETLRGLGFDVAILSGDHPSVVASVGRQLGLDAARCHGGLSPEDKLQHVERIAATQSVVMVGDGVNDAAALAAATVGVAVHGGAETCFAAADVFLQKPGVEPLIELVHGARRTTRTIRNNIVFSLLYNVGGASLAMAGALNPLVAAVLMPVSSLVVTTNSFRFRFVPRVDDEVQPTLTRALAGSEDG
jgi:Cu2+-exporting ATPase